MIRVFDLSWEGIRLYLFILFFIVAGISHFLILEFYVKTIPFLPYPKFVIYVTGILEICFAILLLFDEFRESTSWLIAIYLIAIFPANIYTAIKPDAVPQISESIVWIRLPFQLIFIIWILSLRNI